MLPDSVLLYPGHDYKGLAKSTLGVEKRTNPRLLIGDKRAYIDLMNRLVLPNPRLMDIAIPANEACGEVGP